jgi:DNA modification methylase
MPDVLLYQGDCLEEMSKMPDKSVDLVLTDPPYNIGKAKWDKIPNYIEWCGKWFKECERLLKDNGSFYFWHNDMVQIAQLMEWIRQNTAFVFKRLIVWDKFHGSQWNQLNAIVYSDDNRNYSKQAEYCLFYTFQDETGLTTVMLDTNNFPTMRGYFKELQAYIGLNKKQIMDRIGQSADHCFRWESSQWALPTPETYQQLINAFSIDKWQGFREYESLRQEYESLRQEYESLRQEYESLRYTFNNAGLPSVWQHEPMKQNGHITPKPVKLLENIVKTSSNPGDTVLDCFMGSGSTGVACVNTNRNFIGIELDEGYYNIAEKRIENARTTPLERIVRN